MSTNTTDNPGSDNWIQRYVQAHAKELEELRAKAKTMGFNGKWFIIGDDGYISSREQYATSSFDEPLVSPRLILYAATEVDIYNAIRLCKITGMKLSVRTGGHQYCGFSSTGPENMQLDISKTFTDYLYDAQNNILRCGVGFSLGDWARINDGHGIYLPMGVCAFVNLGGHVHTGGWGMIARSYGILADHVLAFDIILANGTKQRIVRPVKGKTSPYNDDVYYAVLGGSKGGDFGIVTHWEFWPMRNLDSPNSYCYQYIWPLTPATLEKVVENLATLSKLCEGGRVPSDYEFMLTVTSPYDETFLSEETNKNLEAYFAGGVMPGLIVMWMCFTNKGGVNEKFDDKWFTSFITAAGEPLPKPLKVEKRMPVSKGLAELFIMNKRREMPYPFVKRSRATMSVPPAFPQAYTERMKIIIDNPSPDACLHLVSQMQIYGGGAVQHNGKAGITSYSWRDLSFGLSHDAFYSTEPACDGKSRAEAWQIMNDEVFISQRMYANADMRMFAYTFGKRALKDIWECYYDSEDKYKRVKKIKEALDPHKLFSADEFSVGS